MAPVKFPHPCQLPLLAAASIVCCTCSSNASPAAHITQRHINDFAAALDRCRRSILETSGLRAPGEPLPAYLNRIVMPLHGETMANYRVRITGLIGALESAADSTQEARTVPALRNTTQANTALWRRTAKDLGYLPKRMVHVNSAWQSASKSKTPPADAKTLASEILQTLQLIIDAYTNLRDALP